MKLLKICEPVFVELCDFNRVAVAEALQNVNGNDNGQSEHGYNLRECLTQHLKDAEQAADEDPLMSALFKQVKKPLVYFIDDYVVRSPSFTADASGGQPHASVREWRDKTLEEQEFDTAAVGGQEFFTELDAALVDPRPDTIERLLVFKTCLGLGFGGMHCNAPAVIRDYMGKIDQRLRRLGYNGNDSAIANFCKPAYHCIAGKPPPKPTRWLWGVGLAFAILAVGVFVFYFVQFGEAKKELTSILGRINKGDAFKR